VLWSEEGRFYAGINEKGKLDKDLALDASSWGALFLTAAGGDENRRRAGRALAFVEKTFRNTTLGVTGYKPYAGTYHNHPMADWDKVACAWGEGSMGVALAHHRLSGGAGTARCLAIEREIVGKMQAPGGGIRYTVYPNGLPLPASAVQLIDGKRPTDPLSDFLRVPSAASTLWYLITRYSREHNSEVFWGPARATAAPAEAGTR